MVRARRGPSAITIGVGIAAVLISGVVAYLFARARIAPDLASPSIPRARSPEAEPGDVPARSSPASRERALPALPDTMVGAAPVAAPAPDGTKDSAVDLPAASAAAPDPAASARRRKLLVAAQNAALRREADERVFESRRLPEPARAAIREINQELERRTQAYLERAVDAGTSAVPTATTAARAASSPEAEQNRRAALESLLGPDDAAVFQAAEKVAARALAPRYRREWSRQLHAQEP